MRSSCQRMQYSLLLILAPRTTFCPTFGLLSGFSSGCFVTFQKFVPIVTQVVSVLPGSLVLSLCRLFIWLVFVTRIKPQASCSMHVIPTVFQLPHCIVPVNIVARGQQSIHVRDAFPSGREQTLHRMSSWVFQHHALRTARY